VSFVIKAESTRDRRRYNLPIASEIEAIIPDGEVESTRDVVLRGRDERPSRISQLNGKYDPLHYVLLFLKGDLGFGS
jgi:hypothetical protein